MDKEVIINGGIFKELKILFKIQYSVIKWDIVLFLRRKSEVLMPLLFFIMICTLFPLSLNATQSELIKIMPGILWIACLLSSLLSFETLYKTHFEDGTLEQLLLSSSSSPLSWILLGKSLAHWLVFGLPLWILAPVFGLFLNLPNEAILALSLSFWFGTHIFSLMGAIGVALTIGSQKTGLLLAILMLPLWVPIIILGSGMVMAALQGLSYVMEVFMLAAIWIGCLMFAPITTAFAFRETVS